jgi:protein disulfide-isomerase A1
MKACLFAILALVSVSVVAASESKVVVLTKSNFDDFIKNTPLALIEFYAPWCGHCKALAPEYDKASLELEGKNAGVLAKVDCTEERDICNQHDVQGFPTVKLFRNDGSEPMDFDQARKADAIVKFMVRQNAPAVAELANLDAVKGFAKEDSVKVVAFVSDSDNLDGYTKVAKALRNEYSFGVVKGNAAANAEYKVAQTPAVVVIRDFDDGPVAFTGSFSDDAAITSFIKAQSFPLVGQIGPENYAKYLERGFNFVWIFVDVDSDEHKKLLSDQITPVAREFRDKLSFVYLDGVKWVEHAKSFGLSGSTPGIVIENRESRKNFVFKEDQAVTADNFRTFVDGVLKGTIAPTVKSEPVPADNSGPVTTIVGTTFDQIVMDNTKDVLVEFYAPWCGHCKSLAPKFEELGKLFKDDATAVIAKVDATANDTPADIQGFPTLILYPAGDKQNPVNYEGERTVKAMAAWFNANGKANGRPIKSAEVETEAEAEEEEEEGHDHDHHDHDHDDHDHGHDDEL